MFQKYPLIWRLMLFVVAPACLCFAVVAHHLRESLPHQDGELVVAGLDAPVSVVRDAQGVPTIRARSDRDAFFAMGFVHAQDRMWQLELQRRMAAGRMAELFGKGAVQQDIWFRTLGLRDSATEAIKQLTPEALDSLKAYAAGVNAWLGTKPVLPVEFQLLGVTPESWSVQDSLAWVKMLALNLGGDHRREIERLLVGQRVGFDHLPVLFPLHERTAETQTTALQPDQVSAFESLRGLLDRIEHELQLGARFAGSNAWAVSGRYAAGGGLIANDPHLGLQIPSLWYMATLNGERINVSGATLVGLPLVLFGRNESVAWAGTSLMADVQDLYLEQVKPDDPDFYRTSEGWSRFGVREELIEVRQDFPAFMRNPIRPLKVRVRSTRNGPVITDVMRALDQPAALRWTALDGDDTSYEAFFQLNYSSDWNSFEAALSKLVAPAMNMLYTDRAGNIGHLVAGRIPLRGVGNGLLPVPGWDDASRWTGAIPFAALPRRFNPPEGYLVSANNNPVDNAYPYLISHEFASPARADRIARLLRERIDTGRPLDVNDLARIQGDTVDESAQRMAARVGRLTGDDPLSKRALALISAWNGDMRRGSPAATVFVAWMEQLRVRVLGDELRGWWSAGRVGRQADAVAVGLDLDTLLGVLDADGGSWCDDVSTRSRVETCDEVLLGALHAALSELLKLDHDESMQDWAWGDVHHTVYRHMPFSGTSILRGLFERRISNGGSPDSINVSGFSRDTTGFVQDFGAGFRQVIGFSEHGAQHLYMNSTGQSGNVFSPHYDDMVEPFRDLKFHQIGDGSGQRVLSLRPKSVATAGDVR